MLQRVNSEMLIDVVDRRDVPIGVIHRYEVFGRKANFRVAHTLIFNSRGELLVQQLAKTRLRHPGFWGSSVAAYVFAGESYQAAAARRLEEELGIIGAQITYLGKTSMEDEGCLKFIAVFTCTDNGPFTFDKNHIEELEFLPISVIHDLHSSQARSFTPTFLTVLGYYETRI